MPEANQRDIDAIINQYVFPFIWLINFNLEIHLGWGPMGIKKLKAAWNTIGPCSANHTYSSESKQRF